MVELEDMTDEDLHAHFMSVAKARQIATERKILITLRDKAKAKEEAELAKDNEPPSVPLP